ncbi:MULTISPECIES: hypothetical protein [unclassified Bradyrhizobium]
MRNTVGDPKSAKATWVAKYDGVEVGRIISAKPYTHAKVIRRDEQFARTAAYRNKPIASDYVEFEDHKKLVANFEADANISSLVARSKRLTEDGLFETYFERSRQDRIAYFEELTLAGEFRPKVERWLLTDDVERCASTRTTRMQRRHDPLDLFVIVAVQSWEDVSLTELIATSTDQDRRAILKAVCDKAIQQQAWGEITAFLISQFGPDGPRLVSEIISRQTAAGAG